MNIRQQNGLILLALAAFFFALPTISKNYKGTTGKLIVAAPGLPAPFSRTVLFMTGHSLFGAAGRVVNRPFERTMGEKKLPVFYGGPVDCPDVLVGEMPDKAFQVWPNNGTEPPGIKKKKVIQGCAGWSMFQLNIEMLDGGWDVIKYDPELVFDTPPEKMWQIAHDRALQERAIKQAKSSSAPKKLSR
jgi:putative transcriptional regulator